MKINRLLANLPFNPSLIGHVSYYAKRLHQEESIRRIGLGMTVLAMMVQMLAIITPAKQSFAEANGNDIVYGGGDKASFVSAIQNNTDGLGRRDIRAIFEYYLGSNGAAERAIQEGVEETIVSTTANNYYSIGRTVRDGNDIPIAIPGAQTGIYQRTLAGWSQDGTWRAIRVRSQVTSTDMWILTDCGNIVTRGPYTHNPPGGHIDKTAVPAPGSAVKPGDKINYTLLYGNNGPGNMIGTTLFDRVPANTTLIPDSAGGPGLTAHIYNDDQPGSIVSYAISATPDKVLGVDGTNHTATFSVTVNQGVADGTQICNGDLRLSWIDNGQTSNKWLDYNVCHTVVLERCPDGTLKGNNTCTETCPDGTTKVPIGGQAGCPKPTQSVRCEYLREIPGTNRTERTFVVKAAETNGAQIIEYQFDANNDGTTDKVVPAQGTKEVTFTHTYTDKTASYRSVAYVKANVNGTVTRTTSNCATTISVTTPPPTPKKPLIVLSKKVSNITKKLNDANGTLASASDQLEYTFTIKNIGDGDMTNYLFPLEDMSDVLEYANILSIGDGTLSESSKTISWPKVTIPAGGSIVKKVSVVVKNPIPSAPTSISTALSNDLTLQNTFGNETLVKLEKPLPKQVENINRTLPNTGPGTTLAIGFFGTVVVAYFFMRSRILAKELDYVRSEYAAGGL